MLKLETIDTSVPQTHILIIGVGNYPYLRGGEKEVQQADGISALQQLTSTVESAVALYNMAMNHNKSGAWTKQLGSIDLLISRSLPGEMEYEAPTRENVEKAYIEWKKRCEVNEENAAIFYFAGHGMERDKHLLLLEDFGKNPGMPWTGAFELDRTRLAFQRANVKTQCFFIDSCREVNSVLTRNDVNALPLDMPNIYSPECQYDLMIKGTAHNLASYGRANQISFFTQSLIKALEGLAATVDGNGEWIVDMSSISSQITPIMRLINQEQAFEQRFVKTGTDSIELIKLPSPPKAMFKLSCNPEGALPLAYLNCIPWDENNSDWNENKKISRQINSSPWEIELEAGRYKLAAHFENTYKKTFKPGFVRPPFTHEILKCFPL